MKLPEMAKEARPREADEKTARIPDDPELIRELTTPLHDPNFGRGRTKLESKQALKKRGSVSRNLADALVPTFARGVDPRQTSFEDDWPEPDSDRTTWLSAWRRRERRPGASHL